MSNLDLPHDGFFNHLSAHHPNEDANYSGDSPDHGKCEEATIKPKRIACLICRKRKLRCDGTRPSCGNCARLGHECGYSDVRRKSGPRRGYVKELEARLHQVENQLRTKDIPSKKQTSSRERNDRYVRDQTAQEMATNLNNISSAAALDSALPDLTATDNQANAQTGNIQWDIIGLGLEEPLPPQDMIDDLEQIYFDSVHKAVPMIHKYRYLAALNLAPISRPPICLRYAMWTHAASITEKYSNCTDIFYRRARKYVELDELKGHGECFVTVGHAQCWSLLSCFEFKTMYFPRAWMSVGRASRLVQMLGLQRVDHDGLEVKRTLAPPRDWVDREERRRTFWIVYCNDRYASIGTGWPMTFDEKDIFTNLPSSLEAFEKGKPEESISFAAALTADGASHLSALGAVTVVASIFGQNLTHLHRSYDNDDPDDPTNGGFWKRHRQLDALLSTITLFLPEHLKMPTRDQDPNIPFVNMALHTAVICLHQAAILKAEKHQLDSNLIKQSGIRCFHAAEEVYNVMQMISHVAMGRLHPFIAFCMYVAARVLIHAYKKRRDAIDVQDKFEFLLKAMQAHMKKTPLTASFLAQLQVELEAAGLDNPLAKVSLQVNEMIPSTGLGENGTRSEEYIPPVVSSMSQTQPAFHEMQAASNTSSYIKVGLGVNQDNCTVFDLPPRLKSKVTSTPQDSGTTQSGNIVMDAENYPVFGSDMTPGGQSGFTGHPTPSSTQHASSHTSYSPGQEKIVQPDGRLADTETYFAQTGYANFANAVDASFVTVDDWSLVDPALNHPSLNEAGWAQYDDAMAWDNTQAMNLQGLHDMPSSVQWQDQTNVNGNGNGQQ